MIHNKRPNFAFKSAAAAFIISVVAACGNGAKSQPDNSQLAESSNSDKIQYSIGGQAFGITEPILLSDGEVDLSISKNGSFIFRDGLENGSRYSIYVKKQPEHWYCSLTNAEGRIHDESVSSFVIVCSELILTAFPGDQQVSLSWNALPGVTEYKIFRSTSDNPNENAEPLITVAITNYIDSLLTNGTTYYYKIVPIVAENVAIASNLVSVVPIQKTPDNPEKPVGVWDDDTKTWDQVIFAQ